MKRFFIFLNKKKVNIFTLLIFVIVCVLSADVVYAGSYGSWISGSSDATSVYGEDLTFGQNDSDPPENEDPNWFEKLISFPIRLIGNFLAMVLDEIGLTIDKVIFGRLASGATSASFQFGLEDGNVFGVLGSILYGTLRGFMFAVYAIIFVGSVILYMINGTAQSKATIKSVLYSFFFNMALLYAIPIIMDIAIFIVDGLLLIVMELTKGVVGTVNLNLANVFFNMADDDHRIITAALYVVAVCGSLWLGIDYIKRAVFQTYLFGVFPLVALKSFGDKQILGRWTSYFLVNLFVPVVDTVGFMLLLFEASVYGLDTAGGAVLALMIFMSIIPARNMLIQLFGGMIQASTHGLMGAAILLGNIASKGARSERVSGNSKDRETVRDNSSGRALPGGGATIKKDGNDGLYGNSYDTDWTGGGNYGRVGSVGGYGSEEGAVLPVSGTEGSDVFSGGTGSDGAIEIGVGTGANADSQSAVDAMEEARRSLFESGGEEIGMEPESGAPISDDSIGELGDVPENAFDYEDLSGAEEPIVRDEADIVNGDADGFNADNNVLEAGEEGAPIVSVNESEELDGVNGVEIGEGSSEFSVSGSEGSGIENESTDVSGTDMPEPAVSTAALDNDSNAGNTSSGDVPVTGVQGGHGAGSGEVSGSGKVVSDTGIVDAAALSADTSGISNRSAAPGEIDKKQALRERIAESKKRISDSASLGMDYVKNAGSAMGIDRVAPTKEALKRDLRMATQALEAAATVTAVAGTAISGDVGTMVGAAHIARNAGEALGSVAEDKVDKAAHLVDRGKEAVKVPGKVKDSVERTREQHRTSAWNSAANAETRQRFESHYEKLREINRKVESESGVAHKSPTVVEQKPAVVPQPSGAVKPEMKFDTTSSHAEEFLANIDRKVSQEKLWRAEAKDAVKQTEVYRQIGNAETAWRRETVEGRAYNAAEKAYKQAQKRSDTSVAKPEVPPELQKIWDARRQVVEDFTSDYVADKNYKVMMGETDKTDTPDE